MDDMQVDAVKAVEKVFIEYGYAANNIVIVADATNRELESETICATSPGLMAWQSIGLLEFGKTLEQKQFFGPRDDE